MNTANSASAKPGMQQGSQMRITPEEIEIIQRTFGSNERLLLLLRKIFLPEIDPKAPIGQVIDLWMTVNVKDMSPDQAYANLVARNMLITHIDQQLMTLKLISSMEKPTTEEAKAKVVADSAK